MRTNKKQSRLHCEKKIENKKFRLKMGTMNKKEPQVIYVEGRGFIVPLNEITTNDKISFLFKKEMFSIIKRNLIAQDNFDKRFILDLQIADSSIKINKKTYLWFQFLLKQKELKFFDIDIIKKESMPLINSIINDFLEFMKKNNILIFSKAAEVVAI